eukprot:1030681_1
MINYTQNTEGYQMIDALNRITCNRKRSTGSIKRYELRHTNRIRTAQQNIHMISIRAEGNNYTVHMQQRSGNIWNRIYPNDEEGYAEDVYEVYEEDDERTPRVHSVQYENEHEDEEQEESYSNQEMDH